MAVHTIAENIGDVEEQHLAREDLPRRYLWRIWRLLENRGVCFQAWKVFSKFLLAEDDEKTLGLYRYRQHICQPSAPSLRHYLKPLESPNVDFVTHLTITGSCSFGENELLALAKLKNLAILEIIEPASSASAYDEHQQHASFPKVDDRLVRSWSEMDDPFPLLRVLRLWGDESVTTRSLQYVSKFPSLALYDVNASRSDWRDAWAAAEENCWDLDEPLHGPHDSLLWYLLLFDGAVEGTKEDSKPRQLQGMARNIDDGLMNFCQSSNQPITIDASGQDSAPLFLDHLSEAAKRNLSMYVDVPGYEAQTCKGFPFETWGFWLYSFLGQLSGDADLKRAGLKTSTLTAVSEKLVLPAKPPACLQLGHCGSGRPGITPAVSYVRRGLFATSRYTFFRRPSGVGSKLESSVRKPTESLRPKVELGKVETGLNPNRKKRRRLDDILQSFMGS
ncbi:hypothetical protein SGCOL_003901 [Colletotrichum sp. CLE4]